MSLKTKATDLAEQGFFIFPLRENGKRPAVEDWENWATQDLEKINSFWADSPYANIGVACGPSDLLVLDVDNKNGKSGSDTLAGIELFADSVPTYTVKTPTGGYHKYYLRDDLDLRNTVGAFGEGLDTRAIGGYVVGEGSVIGGEEYVLEEDLEVFPPPAWLLGQPKKAEITQTEEKSAVAIDLRRATAWLINGAEPAVQGSGGDSATYAAACQLRDFGLDASQALTLLLGVYNPRCTPEWGVEELQEKIDNAFDYAQNSKGAKSLSTTFEDLSEPVSDLVPFVASKLDFNIPPRDWILGSRLITGFVTVTVAPGGVGKSMYTMVEALAVATGRPLLGETPKKIGPVVIYNTEDPLDEIQRRILAICIQYEIPLAELSNVYLLSGISDPLRLAETLQGHTRTTKDVGRLDRLVKDTKAIVVMVDPFIATHRVDENSNNAIDIVVGCFKNIAIDNKCAVSLVHHTNKMSASTGAGDMNSARGASALASAARIAHTITTMNEKEAKQLQIPEHERPWYIRIDNAKSNMAPPSSGAFWCKKVSVKLPNGDSVGTLEPVDLLDRYLDSELAIHLEAQNLAKEIHAKFGIGEHKLTEIAAWMETLSFDGGNKSTLRRKAQSFFEYPVVIDEIKVAHSFRENRTPKHCIDVALITEEKKR